MMKVLARIALVLTLVCPGLAWADAPSVIPVQGVLTDSGGGAVNDVFAVAFTLYTDAEGTSSVWTEEAPVNFVNGHFTAYLGATTSLDLTTFRDNGSLYLGVKVADDEEMTPFEIGSAPFAGFAQYAGFAADITDAAKVQIVGDVAVQLDNDGKVHDKYTDAEAIAAVTNALATDTTQIETALGTEGDSNPLNHARYTDAEAVAAVEAGPITVNGVVSATGFTASDASVRASGELVFRGSFPVWAGEIVTITDNVNYERVSGTGLCTTCYPEVPALPGSTRRYRLAVLYSDNQGACGTASEWRLGRNDDSSVSYVDWTLTRTYSGSNLYHMRTSQWFDESALSNCDAGWAGGTCSIYAKMATTCPGTSMVVRSIHLEYYDELP